MAAAAISASKLAFTTAGAALATAVMTFPLMVRAIRLSLENVDRGLEEAARNARCSCGGPVCLHYLPLMLPGISPGPSPPWPRPGRVRRGHHLRLQRSRRDPHSLLALYTAMQHTGDALALRLAVLSFGLGLSDSWLRTAGAARAAPAGPLGCCRSRGEKRARVLTGSDLCRPTPGVIALFGPPAAQDHARQHHLPG